MTGKLLASLLLLLFMPLATAGEVGIGKGNSTPDAQPVDESAEAGGFWQELLQWFDIDEG